MSQWTLSSRQQSSYPRRDGLLFPSRFLVISAVAVSATPGLTLKISIPNANVDRLESLKVSTTIINTGDETLRPLNDPHGDLNSFPGDSVTITDTSGSRPSLNDAKVNHLSFTLCTRMLIIRVCF